MLRMFLLAAGLVVAALACSGASQCRDLCSESMQCVGNPKLQCVQGRCLQVTDAGPPNCP